jgi:hypothetical protein
MTAAAVFFLVVGLAVVMILPLAGFGFGFDLAAAVFCGFFLVVIGIVVLAVAAGSAGRRAIPPPPPIQQPMVPAGLQGPMELACPNCGAAPRAVDRFGVATCDYCDTRFLVR